MHTSAQDGWWTFQEVVGPQLSTGRSNFQGRDLAVEGGNLALGYICIYLFIYPYRLHSSSSLGLPYRILNMNPKKELLWSLYLAVEGGNLALGYICIYLFIYP